MPVFVDTKVLVYARDTSEGPKQARALEWVDHLWRTRGGRLSYQVLQELYVTLTSKLSPGLGSDEARADVVSLLAWRPVVVDELVIRGAWSLEDAHRLSFWDALIVSAASTAGCERLLTEDLTDGEAYDGVLVVDPFVHAPV